MRKFLHLFLCCLLAVPIAAQGIGGKAGVGGKAGIGGGAATTFSFNFDCHVPLSGSITFTRGSSGTYIDQNGILQTAGSNVARFNYSQATIGKCLGLLIEPAATNVILQSNTFQTTWFIVNSAVVTPAQFTGPDNVSLSAANVTWAASSFGANVQTFTYSNVQYTMSCWVHANGANPNFRLEIAGGGGSQIISTSSWVRYTLTVTPSAGSATWQVASDLVNAANLQVYGCQGETGAVATSYIATTTGSVTRSADSAAFTIPGGIGHLTFTFDDGSTQTVAVSPGAYTIPTNLNRPNILSVVGAA